MSARPALFTPESIVAAAIQWRGVVVTLPAPARHSDLIRAITTASMEPCGSKGQGFLTSAGRFVDRDEGYRVAVVAGQLRGPIRGCGLCTEDLW